MTLPTAPRLPPAGGPPRLLDRVREAIRARHYSLRTEEAYVAWTRRFILFHNKRHPSEMGEREINAFLSHLAVAGRVSASTQTQALSSLLFLYRHVLERPFPTLENVVRAKRPAHLPVVMTRAETRAVLTRMSGAPKLVATLLYGSGLRLLEGLRLRVKDVEFGLNQILVRDPKGNRDRIVPLPMVVRSVMPTWLAAVKRRHEKDLSEGFGNVQLPFALERKYPGADRQWGWQYVFPAERRSRDPRSQVERRHHLHESIIQRAVRQAVRDAGHLPSRQLSHLPPLFRHAPARGGLRYPHHPGVAGTPQPENDHDLHPRAESRRSRGHQSRRRAAQGRIYRSRAG